MISLSWLQHKEQQEQWPENDQLETARALRFTTYDHEPVGRFLVGRLNLSVPGFVVLALVATACLHLIAVLLYTVLFPSALPDLARFQYTEWPSVIFSWVVIPLILAFYPWMTRVTGRIIADLCLDGVVEREKNSLRALVLDGRHSLKHNLCDKRWTYAALGVAALWSFAAIGIGFSGQWRATLRVGSDIWLFNMVTIPGFAIALYMLGIIVARELATIHGLYRLFNERLPGGKASETIRVRPWHPDGCGGLHRLNGYSIRFSYLIALCGFGLLLATYLSVRTFTLTGSLKHDPILWLAIAIYLVLAPAVFFLTLGSAHRAMLRSKTEHLRVISEQLDQEYRSAKSNLAAESGVLVAYTEKVKRLHELCNLTAKFPVWPFDATTLRRFAVAVIAPFGTTGISIGLNVAVNFFSRVLKN
ncbi:MAG: hypothetical protein HY686_03040, partial [Chloroflexi bacterium]|nr:hypothetical protein [Chloroflexota bacterium]